MATHVELHKPQLYRCSVTISDDTINNIIGPKCHQILKICNMTNDESVEFIKKLCDINEFYDIIDNIFNVNSSRHKFSLLVGPQQQTFDSSSLSHIIDEYLNIIHTENFNFVILGSSDEFDLLMSEKISRYNTTYQTNIRTICLHSVEDTWSNAIKKNMAFDCVIDYNFNSHIFMPLMLQYADNVFICCDELHNENSLTSKLQQCCSIIRPKIKIIMSEFDEESNLWYITDS